MLFRSIYRCCFAIDERHSATAVQISEGEAGRAAKSLDKNGARLPDGKQVGGAGGVGWVTVLSGLTDDFAPSVAFVVVCECFALRMVMHT